MAAWTDTSSALVGSSATTIRGSPANARAIATRCLRPPDSCRGFRSRWRWVRRRSARELVDPLVDGLALEPGQLADRAGQDAARRPAAIEGRVRVLEDHLDRALVGRRPTRRLRRQLVVVELHAPTGVRALDAEDRLGERRLARTRLADEAQRLAVEQTEVDADQRRHVMAALVERLRHALDRQGEVAVDRLLPGDRRRLDELAETVDVVAAAPAAAADVHDRRDDSPAQVGRELAAVDEDAGGQRRADLRQVARDRRERPLHLSHAVARQRTQQPERVRMLRALEDGRGVALLDDLAGVHHADPVAQGPDDAEVVGDEQDCGVGLRLKAFGRGPERSPRPWRRARSSARRGPGAWGRRRGRWR